MRKHLAVLLVFVIVFANTIALVVPAQSTGLEEFDERVARIVDELSELRRMGGNISELVGLLNEAIGYAERGDYSRANQILDSVEASIQAMRGEVEHEYKIETVKKYAMVGFLLVLPLVVYYGLPRVYLALWYRVRRKWIVVEE